MTEDHPAYWRNCLPADLSGELWSGRLYELVVGPELTRARNSLQDCGGDALAIWNGVRSFARWFCELVRSSGSQGAIRYDALRERWTGADNLFTTEVEMAATFQEPGWSRPVVVAGRADHLVRVAGDRWCVIEFKLGAGHPEADAAQVCLYHELRGGTGCAALVKFSSESEPQERFFDCSSIQQARPALLNLIGVIAGVSSGTVQADRLQDRPDETDKQNDRPEWPRPPRDCDIEMGNRLVRALREYGADAKLASEPVVGPTFVRYVLMPEKGVPVSKLEKQSSNLQIRLQVDREPFIGRQGGRIVVDVERTDREYVPFRSILPVTGTERGNEPNTRVLVGVDLYGKAQYADLAALAPHILVGGAPSSGKSEWLRCAVASLVATNSTQHLRLIVIDPKKNAFAGIGDSPYLWRRGCFVDTIEEEPAVEVLEGLIAEILRRNGLLKIERADNISHYMQKTGAVLPRLVCVVDEFAELLMSKDKNAASAIEAAFIRIAAVGRAAGVHLVLATQRPSRQVVSGLLKANMPAKVALRVTNRVESCVVLDQTGAQNLLGSGDLLFSLGGHDPVRLQSAWTSEEERRILFDG